jgi:hypothetical protein
MSLNKSVNGDSSNVDNIGWRSFIKKLGVAGAALPVGALLMGENRALAAPNARISKGDAAILRFLAAAEILETDLWQQYTELALGNAAFQMALTVLDGDMPTYINKNTRDELTHEVFINAYRPTYLLSPCGLAGSRTSTRCPLAASE